MNWNKLTSADQLALIDKESSSQNILIFKHSTRCSISDAALGRLERKWTTQVDTKLKPYYLDLISFRDISNEIAKHYNIVHESPQALIISNGKCVFSQTHMNISLDEIMEKLEK